MAHILHPQHLTNLTHIVNKLKLLSLVRYCKRWKKPWLLWDIRLVLYWCKFLTFSLEAMSSDVFDDKSKHLTKAFKIHIIMMFFNNLFFPLVFQWSNPQKLSHIFHANGVSRQMLELGLYMSFLLKFRIGTWSSNHINFYSTLSLHAWYGVLDMFLDPHFKFSSEKSWVRLSNK